jgi:hypothetical protein
VSAAMRLVQGFFLGWLLRAGMWRFHKTWLQFVPAWALLFVTCSGARLADIANPYLQLLLAAIPAAVYLLLVWLLYPSVAQILLRLIKLPRRRAEISKSVSNIDIADSGLSGAEQALPEALASATTREEDSTSREAGATE